MKHKIHLSLSLALLFSIATQNIDAQIFKIHNKNGSHETFLCTQVDSLVNLYPQEYVFDLKDPYECTYYTFELSTDDAPNSKYPFAINTLQHTEAINDYYLNLNLGYKGWCSISTPTLPAGKYKIVMDYYFDKRFIQGTIIKQNQSNNTSHELIKVSINGENEKDITPYRDKDTSSVYKFFPCTLYEEVDIAEGPQELKILITDPYASLTTFYGLGIDCIRFIPLTEQAQTQSDGFTRGFFLHQHGEKKFYNINDVDSITTFVPTNKVANTLRDYIMNLSDEYSIIRDEILSHNEYVFSPEESSVIGENESGNPVYDSVFVMNNTFFEYARIDWASEIAFFTLLLLTDDEFNATFARAKEKFALWQMDFDEEAVRKRIIRSLIFNDRYTAQELTSSTRTSAYELAIESLNIDAPKTVDVGNCGLIHHVTDLNSQLIYRLKDYFNLYEHCTEEQKAAYFKSDNLYDFSCNLDVNAWSPLEGVWPMIENRALYARIDDNRLNYFSFDFTLLKQTINTNGEHEVSPYLIPPGTYRLAMGFKQNMGVTLKISVLIDGVEVAEPISIEVGAATTYHYDRGAKLPNCYPEGYKEVMNELSHTKKKNYDTDGGLVYEQITIPDVKGDGSPSEVVLRIEGIDMVGAPSRVLFHHWCLRPVKE